MNNVTLIGRISNDLNMQQTTNGKSVVQFNLAVNKYGNEGADFIPVQVWGKTAENLVKFQSKGSQIAVNGRISVENYEKDGQKRSFTKVIANEVEFLGSRQQEKTVAEARFEQKQQNQYAHYDWGMSATASAINIGDSELPF